MDFIGGLREEKNKIRRKSEEEVYQDCVNAVYDDLKHCIHEKVMHTRGNTVEGEVCVDALGSISLYGGNDFMDKKESRLYAISYNPYAGEKLHLAHLCDFQCKSSLFGKQVKATLTVAGKRALPDLGRKASEDGFQLTFSPKVFYPLYDGSGNDGSKYLSGYDVYEKVPNKVTRCQIYARYRIVL